MLNISTSACPALIKYSIPIGEVRSPNEDFLLKMWATVINEGTQSFIEHAHTHVEITLCESGFGEYSTNKTVYKVCPGDIFVFSPNEQHCITKVEGEELHLINLHFDPRCLYNSNRGDNRESFVEFCFFHSPDFSNRISCGSSSFLRESIEKIKGELSYNDKNRHIVIEAVLVLILDDLLRTHMYRGEFLAETDNILLGLLAVFEYIDKNLDQKMTLNTLASISGYSPNYFSHIFKKYSGISLWEYISNRRIEKATHLLLSGESKLTMLDIALDCGFNNTVNFNKVFKKCKGVTPSEFKRSCNIRLH